MTTATEITGLTLGKGRHHLHLVLTRIASVFHGYYSNLQNFPPKPAGACKDVLYYGR